MQQRFTCATKKWNRIYKWRKKNIILKVTILISSCQVLKNQIKIKNHKILITLKKHNQRLNPKKLNKKLKKKVKKRERKNVNKRRKILNKIKINSNKINRKILNNKQIKT